MRTKHHAKFSGFTLVELLVVIAIIAILVAVSASMVFRFKNTGRKVVATNNIKLLQVANMGYAADHNGLFVPPVGKYNDLDVEWFRNPDFISQLKGSSATFKNTGTPDITLDKSFMDPAVALTSSGDDERLENSFGYTVAAADPPFRQPVLEDPSQSAAFITATGGYADVGSKDKIAYRHDDRAIIAYYDGHTSLLQKAELENKASTDIFWKPVPVAPTTP